jgi:ketosteroid isomerase-like protein
MAAKDVGQGLVELCKRGAFDEAIDKYYHENVVSVEAVGDPKEVRGLEAVLAKSAWWNENFEVHSATAEGPYVNGDEFAVVFKLDTTMKATGERSNMEEVAIYTVKDDKIVHERFLMG